MGLPRKWMPACPGGQPFPPTHRTPHPSGPLQTPLPHDSPESPPYRSPKGPGHRQPHGCLGTALGSASHWAWQHRGSAGPAPSPRGSSLRVAAKTSEGLKVTRPRGWQGLNSGAPKSSRVRVSDWQDSPGGSGRTWAPTPGQSEEVMKVVSRECVCGGAREGSAG